MILARRKVKVTNMRFQGSVIEEQGITFGVIIVKPHILHNANERARMQGFGRRVFGLIPIILMAQDAKGVPTYWGRKDIANFLSRVSPGRIPWREYTIA
jgi:ABC-type transport system involved in cytochrome c biogenesis permease subunit